MASLPRDGPWSTELFGTQMVAGASRVIVRPGLLTSTYSEDEFLSPTARVPAQAVKESIRKENKQLFTINGLSFLRVCFRHVSFVSQNTQSNKLMSSKKLFVFLMAGFTLQSW
jgi:hypothetical protein